MFMIIIRIWSSFDRRSKLGKIRHVELLEEDNALECSFFSQLLNPQLYFWGSGEFLDLLCCSGQIGIKQCSCSSIMGCNISNLIFRVPMDLDSRVLTSVLQVLILHWFILIIFSVNMWTISSICCLIST